VSTRRFLILGGVLGLLTALILTHPLARHLRDMVLEDGSFDAYQFLWNLWWVRESLLTLHQDPFVTRFLFYPHEVSLLFHTFSFSLGLLSVPLQLSLPGGLVTAHNVLVIAAPLLTFVTTALLAREITGDPAAALVGAFVAILNPIFVWFLPILYVSCIWLAALLLWLWWSLHRRRTAGLVIAAVIVLAALVLAAPEYAMMALGLIGLDTVLRLVDRRRAQDDGLWMRGAAAFAGLAAIGLGSLALLASGTPATPPPEIQLTLGSGYLAGLVSAPWLFPPPAPFWTVLYLGTAPLLLLPLAAVAGGSRRTFWLLALLSTALMSLGPQLHLHHPAPDLKVPPGGTLPAGPPGLYALALQVVPLLRFIRAPYRWIAITQIVLAVLTALAVAALRRGAASPTSRIVRTATALAMVIGLGALDVRGLRAPLASAAVPRAYLLLRDDPQPCAIVELPSGPDLSGLAFYSSHYMYYQTVHEKFLLEGTVARLPAEVQWVLLRDIADFTTLPYVKYVVIHRDFATRSLPASQNQIAAVERALQSQGLRSFQDDHIAIWELRTFRPETVVPATGAQNP
jgi:hypothetical protein